LTAPKIFGPDGLGKPGKPSQAVNRMIDSNRILNKVKNFVVSYHKLLVLVILSIYRIVEDRKVTHNIWYLSCFSKSELMVAIRSDLLIFFSAMLNKNIIFETEREK
jgi:hypothetical protein